MKEDGARGERGRELKRGRMSFHPASDGHITPRRYNRNTTSCPTEGHSNEKMMTTMIMFHKYGRLWLAQTVFTCIGHFFLDGIHLHGL